MKTASFTALLPNGTRCEEQVLAFDRGRPHRLLIVPALFDEANRLRRFTVEVMRRLDGAGVDTFLIDLPGTNESLVPLNAPLNAPLGAVTPADWHAAASAAVRSVGATHALGLRGGCLFLPETLPGWHYAPVKGSSILRQMLRARTIAAREAGREETLDGLREQGLAQGLELVGYRLGAGFLRAFETLIPARREGVADIGQDMLGGSGLWLRAEPGEDRAQADALAAILSIGIKAIGIRP